MARDSEHHHDDLPNEIVEEVPLMHEGPTQIEIRVTDYFRYAAILASVVGVIASWVAMGFIGQTSQGEGLDLNLNEQETTEIGPYMIAYVSHAMYVIFFTPFLVILHYIVNKREGDAMRLPSEKAPLKTKHYAKAGFILSIIVFAMLYLWYLSLPRTSIAINTSIYQCSSIFVFILSIIFLKELISLIKIISVIICVVGVFLISFGSQGAEESMGDALGFTFLISSTILYALYEVVYNVVGVDPTTSKTKGFYNSILVLVFIGVFTIVIFWPGFFIVHYTGFEPFELPKGKEIWNLFLLALLEATFNLSLLMGIFLTSPLFMSIASMLSVPAAIVCDILVNQIIIPPMAYIGIACIILGFLGLNFAEYQKSKSGKSYDIIIPRKCRSSSTQV